MSNLQKLFEEVQSQAFEFRRTLKADPNSNAGQKRWQLYKDVIPTDVEGQWSIASQELQGIEELSEVEHFRNKTRTLPHGPCNLLKIAQVAFNMGQLQGVGEDLEPFMYFEFYITKDVDEALSKYVTDDLLNQVQQL
jgi:hypothetical protein